ncbi:MAG: aminotransferase class V-fold PLP-dependent enzyme [Candidatus Bathyarchaeota archaeon]
MVRELKEETLDPEDWDELKKLGHRMLEDALNHLQNIRDFPNLQQTDDELQKLLVPLSEKGEGEERVYNLVAENLIPHHVSMSRPQFWGYVAGTGSPYGVLVDMLLTSRNSGGATWGDVPVWLQAQSWIKELLEVPKEYSGVFVAGGSEANYTGLAVARNAKAEVNMKTKGMQNVERKMVLYGSEEIHHCLERSVELLGFGSEALRWIPVDDEYSIKLNDLKKAIKADKKQGLHPFCVVGCAGTVNTGAFDDLNALADICKREDMWLHVDGAFGAWVKLSETHKHLADGLERADSIAIDLHKWMNMPYPIGFTMIKDKVAHYSTFVYGHEAKYLDTMLGSLDLEKLNVISSLALSRENYGLKAYMLLRAYGKERYRRLVQQNIDQIKYLAGLLEKEPNIELTAPVVSNIVCFRYNPGGLSEEQLEKLNRAILGELWKIVMWMISDTTLHGRYTLRACNINNRSRREDFDFLVEEIKKIGAKCVKELS